MAFYIFCVSVRDVVGKRKILKTKQLQLTKGMSHTRFISTSTEKAVELLML